MIVNGHPNSDIDQLLPWAYCRHDLKAVVLRKRGVFGVIKRELRRRSAIEPVIGHMKSDGQRVARAMRPTLSSPQSATISASSSPGSDFYCA